MNSTSDVRMQDLLDCVTKALQQGDDVETFVQHASLPHDDVDALVGIISGLEASLIPVQPRAEFADQLRAELMNSRLGMVKRVRQMPAQVHIAAILALIAGFGLILSRRIFGSESGQDISEEPVATAH